MTLAQADQILNREDDLSFWAVVDQKARAR